jgi:hypothetical protein
VPGNSRSTTSFKGRIDCFFQTPSQKASYSSQTFSLSRFLIRVSILPFSPQLQDYGDRAVNRASAAAVLQAKREAGTFYCTGCGFKGSIQAAALPSDCRREGGTLVLPRRVSALHMITLQSPTLPQIRWHFKGERDDSVSDKVDAESHKIGRSGRLRKKILLPGRHPNVLVVSLLSRYKSFAVQNILVAAVLRLETLLVASSVHGTTISASIKCSTRLPLICEPFLFQLSGWADNVDDSIADVRIAGGRRAPPRPAARAQAVPPSGTVNDLILQALDRRVRTPSEPNAWRRVSPAGSVPEAQAAEPQTPAKPAPVEEAPATATVKSESKPAKTPYASVLSPQSPQTNPSESLSVGNGKSPSEPLPLETPQIPPKPLPTPVDHLSELHADILVQIMDRLDAPSLSALVRASRRFVLVSTERGAWVHRELQCFHSKLGFTEEVLGFGRATKGSDTPPGSRHCGVPDCPACGPLRRGATSKPSTGKWEGVLSMDYISSGAFFEGGVRKGVWNER